MKKYTYLILISVLFFSGTSCSFIAILQTDSKGVTTDSDGRIVGKDTDLHWSNFIWVVNGDIIDEKAGQRPPGRRKSWNERWLGSIKSLREGRENSHRYINYIIEERRKQGLPELTGI